MPTVGSRARLAAGGWLVAAVVSSASACGLGSSGEGSTLEQRELDGAAQGPDGAPCGSACAGGGSGGAGGASSGFTLGPQGDAAGGGVPQGGGADGSAIGAAGDASTDGGADGGVDGGAICSALGVCCTAIMTLSPSSNVQSCVQAAQSGNASLCTEYYGLLASTGLTAFCP